MRIFIIFLLIILAGAALWLSQQKKQDSINNSVPILKDNMDDVLLLVSDHLNTLRAESNNDTDTQLDGRYNTGGSVYTSGPIKTLSKGLISVPLIIRTSLPSDHPAYEELPTPFVYTVDISGGEYAIMSRPTSEELRDFFQNRSNTTVPE